MDRSISCAADWQEMGVGGVEGEGLCEKAIGRLISNRYFFFFLLEGHRRTWENQQISGHKVSKHVSTSRGYKVPTEAIFHTETCRSTQEAEGHIVHTHWIQGSVSQAVFSPITGSHVMQACRSNPRYPTKCFFSLRSRNRSWIMKRMRLFIRKLSSVSASVTFVTKGQCLWTVTDQRCFAAFVKDLVTNYFSNSNY